MLTILQKHNQGAPITSSASVIEMDLMRFRFAPDGSLERIERTDDYGFPAGSTPRIVQHFQRDDHNHFIWLFAGAHADATLELIAQRRVSDSSRSENAIK
jgi:hypothetical protein